MAAYPYAARAPLISGAPWWNNCRRCPLFHQFGQEQDDLGKQDKQADAYCIA